MDALARLLVTLPTDPIDAPPDDTHRVVTFYALDLETRDRVAALGDPITSILDFARLDSYYKASGSQLPRIIYSRRHASPVLHGPRIGIDGTEAAAAWKVVLDVPAGPLILAVVLDVACSEARLVPLLEDAYYAELKVNGVDPDAFIDDLLKDGSVRVALQLRGSQRIEAERHQLVDLADRSDGALPTDDDLQRLIYRANLEWRPTYSSILHASELNRRPTSSVAMGPFVSVLYRQQQYIFNSAFASAGQLVSASAKARTIRAHAYESLVRISGMARSHGSLAVNQARRVIAESAQRLADEELQLTFGVESTGALMMLVPSLRVVSYHSTLSTALGLDQSVRLVSDMLLRLRAVLDAEKSSLQAYDERRQELRRFRWSVSVAIFTTIGVPLGVFLSFFGGQESEVHPRASLFSIHYYAGLYIFIALWVVLAAGAFSWLFYREGRALRHMRSSD